MDSSGGPAQPSTRQVIRTPDQRLRVFVSSTLHELAEERSAARQAITGLRLAPVMFELGARPHPPRDLYRAYLQQSHVFVGIYWERYGWVAPGEDISGLEDEYRLSTGLPKLIYVKQSDAQREDRLVGLLNRIQSEDQASYKHFTDADDLRELLTDDLALLLSERFEAVGEPGHTHGVPVPRTSVPIPPTPMVGRSTELRRLTDMIAEPAIRLVTLTGGGGVGKTRVAQAVAHEGGSGFRDGVGWVDLGSVTEEHQAIGELASAADAVGENDEDLEAALRNRQILFVLDTIEHLPQLGLVIGRLLAHLPDLSILATGRTPFHISAERVFPLGPLPLPSVDGADLETAAAGRLLLDRARAARPDLELSGDDAAALASICHALDGLPLALELAAARLRLFSPRAMAARLESSGEILTFLTGGARDLPGRQRTLAATIEWSFHLLSPQARSILHNLAVFAGAFGVDSVEAVAGDEPDPLGALTSLLEGGLLRSQDTPAGTALSVPRSVREYACARLKEEGGLEAAQHRHANHVRDRLREISPSLHEGDTTRALDEVQTLNDEVRTALRWAIATPKPNLALEMCGAVFRFWQRRGWLAEGRRFLEETLAISSPEDEPLLYGKALFAASVIAGQQGDLIQGRSYAEASVDLLRGLDDPDALADALNSLGTLVQEQGDFVLAIELLDEALAIRRAMGSRWGLLVATLNLGNTYFLKGEYADADRLWSDAHRLAEDGGENYVRAMILNNVGALRRTLGKIDEARELFESSLAIRRDDSDPWGMSTTLNNLGEIATLTGQLDIAAEYLTEALAIQRELADRKGTLSIIEAVAQWAVSAGNNPAAAELFSAAESLRDELDVPLLGPDRELVADAVELLGQTFDVGAFWERGKAMTLNEAIERADSTLQASSSN